MELEYISLETSVWWVVCRYSVYRTDLTLKAHDLACVIIIEAIDMQNTDSLMYRDF